MKSTKLHAAFIAQIVVTCCDLAQDCLDEDETAATIGGMHETFGQPSYITRFFFFARGKKKKVDLFYSTDNIIHWRASSQYSHVCVPAYANASVLIENAGLMHQRLARYGLKTTSTRFVRLTQQQCQSPQTRVK